VHHIEDLSELLELLSKGSTKAMQFELAPGLQKSLKGCLELGIKQIVSFSPMIMTPRQRRQTADDPHLPIQKVWPKDFQKHLQGNNDSSVISVDRKLLAEGLCYLDNMYMSDRFEQVFDGLDAAVKATDDSRVNVLKVQAEEVADWLDLIMRSRPNEIGRALRRDVKAHNAMKLGEKIRPPKARKLI
jgi:hypothetical protein